MRIYILFGIFFFALADDLYAYTVSTPIQKTPENDESRERVEISWRPGIDGDIDGDYFEVAYGTTRSCTDGSEFSSRLYRYIYYTDLKRGKTNYFRVRAITQDQWFPVRELHGD